MFKIILATLLAFPLLANAADKCGSKEVAFYADLESGNGAQRLCYDKEKKIFYFGIRYQTEKKFDNYMVSHVEPYMYKDKNSDEMVKGYQFILDDKDKSVIGISYMKEKIQSAFIAVGSDVTIGYVKESVIFNEFK